MQNKIWTIKDVLDFSTKYLSDHGCSSARLDSELLLAHLLKCKRIELYLMFDRALNEGEKSSYREIIRRRGQHEPVAYLTGTKEFWSRDFVVKPTVLVPRPETELVVDVALELCKNYFLHETQLRGLDVGCGSGVIAITLALQNPHLGMFALDVSHEALELTRENAEKLSIFDRVTLLEKDFFDFSTEEKFHLIVSNPPYIAHHEKDSLPKDVVCFEPERVLFAGKDGLDFYPALADFARKNLLSPGILVVEIGEKQGQAVREIFKNAGFENIKVRKDFAGHDRIVSAVKENEHG